MNLRLMVFATLLMLVPSVWGDENHPETFSDFFKPGSRVAFDISSVEEDSVVAAIFDDTLVSIMNDSKTMTTPELAERYPEVNPAIERKLKKYVDSRIKQAITRGNDAPAVNEILGRVEAVVSFSVGDQSGTIERVGKDYVQIDLGEGQSYVLRLANIQMIVLIKDVPIDITNKNPVER